jgi:hypothetical protein
MPLVPPCLRTSFDYNHPHEAVAGINTTSLPAAPLGVTRLSSYPLAAERVYQVDRSSRRFRVRGASTPFGDWQSLA